MNAGPSGGSAVVARSGPSGGTLADVLDRILDKGIVIDAWLRLSIVGFEVLTVEARVVVASVETYLKYAQAIGAVGIASKPGEEPPPKRVPIEVTKPPEQLGAESEPAESKPAESKPGEPKPAQLGGPSEDDIVGYLQAHRTGLRLEEIEEHFHAPRPQVEQVVNHLVEGQKVRKDEEHDLFLPAQPGG
jgi:hypothetical protein